ncbi:MAG: nicotinamide-nucleotide adenylyltransferase [Caldisphaeraceae archaeon]|nr:nicotinamide-nucleotide adenylyltransferase [Caldisphaeraceae archaeon]
MKTFNRLVFPGRFQPVHYGHIKAIEYALEFSREVIVVVGSAQESYTIRNPLTAGERIMLLRVAFEREFGDDYCKRIFIAPIIDTEMNKVWVQYLRMLLPEFDGVVSGNPLVLSLFKDMGYSTLIPNIYKRDTCKGTIIRKNVIDNGGERISCVPEYLLELLKKVGFIERLRSLSQED